MIEQKKIELSIAERQIMINQFCIMQMLDPNNSKEYENKITALQYGYEIHYPEVCDLMNDDPMTIEDCREVLDILEMYRCLIFSNNNLAANHILVFKADDIKFPGFDGNEETKQYAYADYFINQLDRYSEIKAQTNGYLNSHCNTLSSYRRMLAVWKEIRETKGISYSYRMEKCDVERILNAKYGLA